MIVYCDTSFLVSYLNEDDVNYHAARDRAARLANHDFVVCEVHLIELPAALRAATHRTQEAIPAHVARRVINRFDRCVTGKVFTRKPLDMADAVSMTRSLGDAHGWSTRHTAFDLWHLGAAWTLSSGAFLTFDDRQRQLAQEMGMQT